MQGASFGYKQPDEVTFIPCSACVPSQLESLYNGQRDSVEEVLVAFYTQRGPRPGFIFPPSFGTVLLLWRDKGELVCHTLYSATVFWK